MDTILSNKHRSLMLRNSLYYIVNALISDLWTFTIIYMSQRATLDSADLIHCSHILI